MYQLWQHSNGIWYILYGPRLKKRLSTRTRNRRDADIELAQFIAGNQEPALESQTVTAILQGYEADHGKGLRGQCALKAGTKALTRHLGKLTPNHLTPTAMKRYATARQTDGVKAGTILREIGQLRAAMTWAKSHNLIEVRPDIRSPVQPPPPRDKWLSKDEARRLLEGAREPHVKLFIMVALMTGARSGAILEATWKQVSFDPPRIDFGQGHGNKRRATSPINAELMTSLKAAREMSCSEYVIEWRGGPLKTIKTGFARACERAGLEDVTPHILRHTAATWAASQGVPLQEIARMLGDSMATVERVYAKWSPDYLKGATDALQLGLATVRQSTDSDAANGNES